MAVGMAVGAVPVQIARVGVVGVSGGRKDSIMHSAEFEGATPVVGCLLISGLLFDADFFLLAPASFGFFLLRQPPSGTRTPFASNQ